MAKQHQYKLTLAWLGNVGSGTLNYQAYNRDFVVIADGKPPISGSSDPSFRGDATRYNPEEMLLMAVSSCHMLWYLHLCAVNNIIVEEYTDEPTGIMEENQENGGQFTSITLNPIVKLKELYDTVKLNRLHSEANRLCFIANSLNFKILHEPGYIFE